MRRGRSNKVSYSEEGGLGTGDSLYSEIQCIMGNGHMGPMLGYIPSCPLHSGTDSWHMLAGGKYVKILCLNMESNPSYPGEYHTTRL